MDTSSHTMQALFAQLGLPNSATAMDNFMQMFAAPGQTKPKEPTGDKDIEVIDDK